jgi:hypothetical protein
MSTIWNFETSLSAHTNVCLLWAVGLGRARPQRLEGQDWTDENFALSILFYCFGGIRQIC